MTAFHLPLAVSRIAFAATLLAASLVPLTAGPANAVTCQPSTRVLDTASLGAQVLSKAGHAVVVEHELGTNERLLVLHDPDVTKAPVRRDDFAPTHAVDVNGRGLVVGTETLVEPWSIKYQPWIFRGERVRDLSTPGRQNLDFRKDYFVTAVNAQGSAVGVKTNRDRVAFTSPDYVSKPVLWTRPADDPITLRLPPGMHLLYGQNVRGHIDILNDGTITGLVHDGEHRYLALWVSPGAPPEMTRMRDTWHTHALAGQWVIGRVGATGRVFLRSWTSAFTVDAPEQLFPTWVSRGGLFAIAEYADDQSVWSYVGDASGVHDVGEDISVSDLTGSFGGQLLITRPDLPPAILTCALGLPSVAEIEVTPVDLR